MAYEAPTAEQFKQRFAEFNSVSDELVNEIIAEAGISVGDNWPEDKRPIAHKLLAAHYLAFEGEPMRSNAIEAGVKHDPRPLSSRKVGDVSTTFANTRFGAGEYSALKTTRYGERYLEMRRNTFIGIAVT